MDWKRNLWWPPKEKKIKKDSSLFFINLKTLEDVHKLWIGCKKRWHKEEQKVDGILRHLADSSCRKSLDVINDFGFDPWNVCLGLVSDGFNPFGNVNVSYSIWSVILLPHNLLSWECMKWPNTFLFLLIPSPHGSGNNIDVYLQSHSWIKSFMEWGWHIWCFERQEVQHACYIVVDHKWFSHIYILVRLEHERVIGLSIM